MQSEFGKIDWLDLGKGILIAFLTVILTGVIDVMKTGVLPNLNAIMNLAVPGLAAGLAYLLKNVFTNSQNQLGKSEDNLN